MKRILVVAGALAVLCAADASAAPGLDMAWGGCPLDPANPSNLSDLCTDSSAPSKYFWLSFKAPAGITRFYGEEFGVDVQTDLPVLPDWWHLEAANPGLGVPAGCRDGDYAFASTRNGASTASCTDYWGPTNATGETVWLPGTGGENRTRMVGTFGLPGRSATAITADVEYYVGSGFITMDHADLDPSTTHCNGCLVGTTLVFNYLLVSQPPGTPGGDILITTANVRNVITWQRGPVPVRRQTWGRIKSLYR